MHAVWLAVGGGTDMYVEKGICGDHEREMSEQVVVDGGCESGGGGCVRVNHVVEDERGRWALRPGDSGGEAPTGRRPAVRRVLDGVVRGCVRGEVLGVA